MGSVGHAWFLICGSHLFRSCFFPLSTLLFAFCVSFSASVFLLFCGAPLFMISWFINPNIEEYYNIYIIYMYIYIDR